MLLAYLTITCQEDPAVLRLFSSIQIASIKSQPGPQGASLGKWVGADENTRLAKILLNTPVSVSTATNHSQKQTHQMIVEAWSDACKFSTNFY